MPKTYDKSYIQITYRLFDLPRSCAPSSYENSNANRSPVLKRHRLDGIKQHSFRRSLRVQILVGWNLTLTSDLFLDLALLFSGIIQTI